MTTDHEFCTGSCEHLRSFRNGWDNQRVLGTFNIRDRQATCALKPEMTLHLMAFPRCWREE
jgi:hypothetical protein